MLQPEFIEHIQHRRNKNKYEDINTNQVDDKVMEKKVNLQ